MIYILGIKGNMGRRYEAVLRYLGEEVEGSDVGEIPKPTVGTLRGIINATPTDRHIDTTEHMLQYRVPILVEKPFCKSSVDIEAFEKKYKKYLSLITVVNQYQFMSFFMKTGNETYYDFYNSGRDGLHWDAINLIGMAEGPVSLKNESPFWKCGINGVPFRREDVDYSYIQMIRHWMANHSLPIGDWDYIKTSTRKVEAWLKY